MSLFITFEGGEGSGKSTQARALHRRLLKSAVPAVLTREPGGTALGERISRWLKWGGVSGVAPEAELMLFNASRAQLIAQVIKPGLEAGKVVICDRFADSTIAYQGYGRGLDLELVRMVNRAAVREVRPDLTILMDLPAEVGMARRQGRKPDRFELEDTAFHGRVREGYLKLTGEEPDRWRVLDAAQPKARVALAIWQEVSRLLAARK